MKSERHLSVPKAPCMVINPIAKLRNRQTFEAGELATERSEQVNEVRTKMAKMMMVGDIDCSIAVGDVTSRGFRV